MYVGFSTNAFNNEPLLYTINLISKIGEKYYMPRGKDLKNLVKKMQLYSFNKSTLGGCIIEKINNSFFFDKETIIKKILN